MIKWLNPILCSYFNWFILYLVASRSVCFDANNYWSTLPLACPIQFLISHAQSKHFYYRHSGTFKCPSIYFRKYIYIEWAPLFSTNINIGVQCEWHYTSLISFGDKCCFGCCRSFLMLLQMSLNFIFVSKFVSKIIFKSLRPHFYK